MNILHFVDVRLKNPEEFLQRMRKWAKGLDHAAWTDRAVTRLSFIMAMVRYGLLSS